MDYWPTDKAPYESNFLPTSMSAMKTNNLNPRVEVQELDHFWEGELEYRNLDPTLRRVFTNFFLKQNGPNGEFYYVDHKHTQLGNWSGTPRVKGADQDGNALLVDGLSSNTLIAPEGDRFQLGDFLYHLTADVFTNGSGEVELRFIPDLRKIPADNESLIVVNPACKCMLFPNQKAPSSRGITHLTDWRVKIRESIR